MNYTIKRGFKEPTVLTFPELKQGKGPQVFKCVENRRGQLEVVSPGLEVFGATYSAVKDAKGVLHRVLGTDVVLLNESGDVVVLDMDVFEKLYGEEVSGIWPGPTE